MNEPVMKIITIDGPSGAGKGTISQLLATKLGYHYLDSGAIYRLLALAARRHKVAWSNHEELAVLAAHMDITFEMNPSGEGSIVILEGENVSDHIRKEDISLGASEVGKIVDVRSALLERQRAFAKMPGLVADGRDMGTVVFPDADLKIYLSASAEERGLRRYNQLNAKGENVSLAALTEAVQLRDTQDMTRDISPLVPATDAVYVDSTGKGIEQVFAEVTQEVRNLSVR